MVNVGDKAPDFTVKDQNGNDFTLSSLQGKKVLLAFFPFAFSPVCDDELCGFQGDLSQFTDKGVEVLSISVDSHWTQKAFAAKTGAVFPLLSDFDKKVAQSFGVLRDGGFAERAYFVIDEEGVIQFKHIMDNPGTKLDNEEVFKALV